jgi:S1-C subfamily serine protease
LHTERYSARLVNHRIEKGTPMQAARAIILAALTILSIPVAGAAQTPGEVFRKVTPSVVVIRAKGSEVTTGGQVRFTETGSGVLISADGKVMTAAHVVHSMNDISVEFLGGDTVSAKVIASEPAADLSLIQLERVPAGAKVAVMANSDRVRVGDPVYIVGAPYGLSYSLSAGLISARWAPNTVHRAMPLAEFFQTNATINTGNSGGPMFNAAGEVIGIVSHNISKSGGSEGLGFVVTMKTAQELLLAKKSFWGGLEGEFLSDELLDLLNVPNNMKGYLVKSVAKGSPGDEAGLRGGNKVVTVDGQQIVLGGDIILSVEGVPAESAASMMKIRDHLATLKPGASLTATVLRAGKVIELTGVVP